MRKHIFAVGVKAPTAIDAESALSVILKRGNLENYEVELHPDLTEIFGAPKQASPALSNQVGGSHYKNMAIQPVEFCQRNKLGFCESSAIKYLVRHGEKGKAEDIKKAIHFLNLLLELEYPEAAKPI